MTDHTAIRDALVREGVDAEVADRAAAMVAAHQTDRELVRALFADDDTGAGLFTRREDNLQ